MTINLEFEIRESTRPNGDLLLEAIVEKRRVATGRASQEILSDIQTVLGFTRVEVAEELREALASLVKGQLATVAISHLKEDPDHPLKFTAQFTMKHFDEVSTGIVWYNVGTSTTGPDYLPAIVLNKMRHEVHRLLTSDSDTARELVESSEEESK